MDATRSVADGHRPMERDQPYGRGLLFPVAAAPVVALAPNQLDAYRGLKWFNAFVFSLAAIPAFFLARRFLSEGWSLVVAGLTVAVPSSVYSGMVLTEAAAYVTGTLALLALLQVIERPTARRQLYALGAVALAALARPQLVALGAALPVGLALRWWLLPKLTRPRVSTALRRLWPTAAAVGFVVVVGVAALASGHASLRDYRDVFRTYDVVDVARWSWYTLGNLGLYVAIVPLVAAPAALADLWRRGRAGSVTDASFLGLFLTVNVVTILLVAAFSSATFGGERLHDRYLFYVIPLWLVLFALWLVRGAPASWRSLALGCGLTGLLLVTIPQNLLLRDTNLQFDAVATAVWARVRAVDPARPGVLRLLLVVAVLAALGAIVAARRGSPAIRRLLLVPIAARLRPERRVRLGVAGARCRSHGLRRRSRCDLVVGRPGRAGRCRGDRRLRRVRPLPAGEHRAVPHDGVLQRQDHPRAPRRRAGGHHDRRAKRADRQRRHRAHARRQGDHGPVRSASFGCSGRRSRDRARHARESCASGRWAEPFASRTRTRTQLPSRAPAPSERHEALAGRLARSRTALRRRARRLLDRGARVALAARP